MQELQSLSSITCSTVDKHKKKGGSSLTNVYSLPAQATIFYWNLNINCKLNPVKVNIVAITINEIIASDVPLLDYFTVLVFYHLFVSCVYMSSRINYTIVYVACCLA